MTLEMKYMGGRERYVEMREKEEKGPGGGGGDEIKNPEVSTKTVSSPESPQLPGKVEEEEQMEAVIGFLPISSINRFTHN